MVLREASTTLDEVNIKGEKIQSGRCATGFAAQIQHALVIVRRAAAGVRLEHGKEYLDQLDLQ